MDVVEAARVDGANALQIFRHLTFPHLRQYLELGGLLGSIYIVQNFDAVFTITSGGLGSAIVQQCIAWLRANPGPVMVDNNGGTLSIENINGDTTLIAPGGPRGNTVLSSVNGSIMVRAPVDSKFAWEVETIAGEARTPLPVRGGQFVSPTRFVGSINAPSDIKLVTQTFRGNVFVLPLDERGYGLLVERTVAGARRLHAALAAADLGECGIVLLPEPDINIVCYVVTRPDARGLEALNELNEGIYERMSITRAVSSGRSTVAAISPDGKYLAYSVDEWGKQGLWVRQLASGTDIQVVPLGDVHFVGATFSPDSNYLYYVSADNDTDRGAVYQIPVIGGTPRMLMDDLHARVAVSPDGREIAYVRTDRAAKRSILARRSVAGGEERVVAEKKLPDTFTNTSWSPDGTELAFTYVTYGGGYHAIIGTMPAAGGDEKVINAPRWRIVDTLGWMPETNELVINAKDRSDSRNQLSSVQGACNCISPFMVATK